MTFFSEKMSGRKRGRAPDRIRSLKRARRAIRDVNEIWMRGHPRPVSEDVLSSSQLEPLTTNATNNWIQGVTTRLNQPIVSVVNRPNIPIASIEDTDSDSSPSVTPAPAAAAAAAADSDEDEFPGMNIDSGDELPSMPVPQPPSPMAATEMRRIAAAAVQRAMQEEGDNHGEEEEDRTPKSMIYLLESMRLSRIIDDQEEEGKNEIWVDLLKFQRIWAQVVSDLSLRYPGALEEPGDFYIKAVIRLLLIGDTQVSVQYDISRNVLIIPFKRVNDLSRSIFLYILHFFSVRSPGIYTPTGHRTGPWDPLIPLNQVKVYGEPLRIKFSDLMETFVGVISLFRTYFDEHYLEITDEWIDRESGETIIFLGFPGDLVEFKLTAVQNNEVSIGTRWSDELGELLNKYFPAGGLFTIMNRYDDLCLVYTIAAGLCRIAESTFCSRKRVLDVNDFAVKVSCMSINGGWSSVAAQQLMQRVRGRKEGDIFDKIERLEGEIYSTRDASEKLREIEDEIVDKKACIDIYSVRISGSGIKRIFPCYISRRKVTDENRIEIVNVCSKHMNHYCLITNGRKVFQASGGKIFDTCSKCHQSFYSKALLSRHKCTTEAGRYSWNMIGVPNDYPPEGKCEKCHLQFTTEEEAEYHRKHCFMRHRSGCRYVKLDEEGQLCGKKPDEDEQKLSERKVMFADFESTINEEGVHEIMSYGLYDSVANVYHTGYSIEEFMELLVQLSKAHKEIHVYFHNAMNYDANFILRYVLKHFKDWSINVIMKSSSRLQTVKFLWQDGKTKRRIRIGDTFHFLTMSLERIVNSVRKEDVKTNQEVFSNFFREFGKKYPWVGEEDVDKVLHKNLFPYKFFNSKDRLDTTYDDFERIFRPVEDNLGYFSESVSLAEMEENYPKFLHICEVFRIKSARDYHDLYLLCDVMQITDVFLRARKALHETHHIDLTKYIGMPGASWSAFLQFDPSLKLPLYWNTRQAEFFSSMTRGGVTSAPLRYAKSDATHSIIYLDVNGLYPFVMQKYLYPCGYLKWVDFTKDPSINQNPEKYFMDELCPRLKSRGEGCCIAVDMYFPDEVKKLTEQFPFAPEHLVLHDCYYDENGDMYPFLQKWSTANGGEKMKPFVGLVGTLYPKTEYGVHWKLLRWYVKHGVKITKIYHGVIFKEGDYLRGYVQLNINIRNGVSDELRKMYKLLGNSIYGKTFESPFNRGTYVIVRNQEKLGGMLEEGCVSSITPIDEENCIVKMDAEEVVLDKPTYIGACVTEYAKLHMYKLFYDKLMKVFPGIELVYTDTDSFIIKVEHEPGLSPKELFTYIDGKCPGLFGKLGGQVKSETGEDDLIEEVIALRSKLYAYKTTKGKIGKRAKGTTAAAQEKELDWDAYKNALFELKAIPTHNVQFKRNAFTIQTVEIMKQSISVNDGKRYICDDGIHTHAWGWVDGIEHEDLGDDEEDEEEEDVPERHACVLF